MSVITRTCPIECLAPLLTRLTFAALAKGVSGSPATVGQVIELYEQHRLMEIMGISTGRAGEIKHSLIEVGLIEPVGRSVTRRPLAREVEVRNGHHVTCPEYLSQSEGQSHAESGSGVNVANTIIRDQEALSTPAPTRRDRSSVRGPA